ncbi:permease [Haloplasma contractile]|uniref:Membrane protein n=1 Tax=Haloplasma contractile SSD-17B TaxID=1033810 RepID=U2E9F3_9MOLU|nr:permease [Haloplasma contractile]ERJ11481.1 Putative membrane protein [Haloplasma contractile SSD-17B]
MNIALYSVTTLLLILSVIKDKRKTKKALKKAYKAFENILPQFLGIIILVGIVLAFFNAELVSKIIGNQSGIYGTILSLVVGSITLIPAFVAFPMASLLIENGVGYMQIGAFVSSLMMVGFVTIPLEMKYFGKKTTLLRNLFALLFSFVVAIILGKVMS